MIDVVRVRGSEGEGGHYNKNVATATSSFEKHPPPLPGASEKVPGATAYNPHTDTKSP
jgi:hypothetical protein